VIHWEYPTSVKITDIIIGGCHVKQIFVLVIGQIISVHQPLNSGSDESDLADGHVVYLFSKNDPSVTLELTTRLKRHHDDEGLRFCDLKAAPYLFYGQIMAFQYLFL